MWPWIEAQELDTVLLEKAERLAAAPHARASSSAVGEDADSIDPSIAPLVAQRLCVREIPLAPGLNSAAHVGWLGEDMGQTTSESAVRRVLRSNAVRDWMWFATHRRLSPVQREIVALVPRWSRSPAAGDRHAAVARDVVGGQDVRRHRATTSRSFPDLGGRPGPAPTPELWAARLADGRASGRVGSAGDVAWGPRGL